MIQKKVFRILLALSLCLADITIPSDVSLIQPQKASAGLYDKKYDNDYYDDYNATPTPDLNYNAQNAYRIEGAFKTELIETMPKETFSFDVTLSGVFSVYIPESDTPSESGWDDEFYLTNEAGQIYGPYHPRSDKTQNDNLLIEKHMTPGKYVLLTSTNKRQIYISYTPADAIISSGNNKSFDTAQTCTVNQDIYGDTRMYPSKDAPLIYSTHYFRFTLAKQGMVSLEGELPGYTDDSHNPLGLYLYSEAADGNTQEVLGKKKYSIQLPAGNYFLLVVVPDKDVDRTVCQEEYHCKINYTELDSSYEWERNDTWETANEMTLTGSLKGTLQSKKDRDYYHLKLTNPSILQATFIIPEGVSANLFRISLNQLDTETNKLKELHAFDSKKKEKNRGKKIYAAPGDYYILVKSGNSDDWDDDYDGQDTYSVSQISTINYQISFTDPDEDYDFSIENISVKRIKKDKVKIKWKKLPNFNGYIIYRKAGGDYEQIGMTTKASYIDTIKKTGCTYSYLVKPYYKDGNEEIEADFGTKITFKIPSKINVPSFRLQRNSSRVTLTISNWGFADKVYVYRKQGGSGWKKAGTLNKRKRRTFSAPGNATSYSYRIRGCTKIGSKTVWSNYSSAKRP